MKLKFFGFLILLLSFAISMQVFGGSRSNCDEIVLSPPERSNTIQVNISKHDLLESELDCVISLSSLDPSTEK